MSVFVEDLVDGHLLPAGAAPRLRVRVYVSQDRAPGVYRGSATVTLREEGGAVRTVELPIEVEVPR